MKKQIIAAFTLVLFLSMACDPILQMIAEAQDSAMPPTSELAGIQSDQESGKVSLDLKGMDIVEVIKMLATKGNLNVVLGTDVKGKVTIFLKSVNLMDALDIILIANNLAYDRRGDIIYIMSQRDYERMYGEKYAEKKEAMIFRLKYAKAADIGKALNQIKTKVGKIIIDEGSNTIVAMDNPSAIVRMNETIQSIDTPTVTKIFELRYAKATDMKDKVVESLTKGMGTIQIDERTNKIAITDLEKKLQDIEKMIVAFDDKSQQVLIEAKILQITLSDQLKLGVDWTSVIKQLQKEINLKSAFQLAAFNAFGPPGAEMLIGSLGDSGDVNIMIQVLKTIGDTNLLSSPRITALNNQEAKILIGTSQPYATNTVTQTTGTATTGTNISFLDIGVKLYVTPTINKDGFITMKIRPEVSSTNSNYTYGTPATTIPVVQTTQAETSVSIKDGATIIIGGLIKDQRTETVNKIPILGDLPIIKYAFSNTDVKVEKQELVIFLTPHIISGESDYMDPPKTPPIDEGRFTVPEKPAFERRDEVSMKPGMFKGAKKYQSEEDSSMGPVKKSTMETVSIASTSQEYYYSVKNKIIEHISLPKDAKYSQIKGKVKLSFFLTPAGKVTRGPDILESSNHELDDIALRAVKRAGSFSVFPEDMGRGEKRFVMDIAFE
ncbi:MAG: TonB family protein [Candidatus Omnitrophota bacterium]|nr:TonB family protein [Candidatus Omnitrophota bacterium]